MPQHRFVISVAGGILEVFTNIADVEVILVDWDLDAFDAEQTPPVELNCVGEQYKVFVEPYAFEKLPTSPVSFVGSALAAKGYLPVTAPLALHLSDRELATVLAALRCFQDDLREAGEVLASMDHFQTHTPLSVEEINALCDRLN